MDGWGGLIELVLVFGLVLGFAVYELMSLRRYRKRKAAEADKPIGRSEP